MTTKIFWPEDLPRDTQDFLYGWKLAPNWFVVAFAMSSHLTNTQADAEGKGRGLAKGLPLIKIDDIRDFPLSPHQYILYKRPNTDRLRFFATQPLDLDTSSLIAQPGVQHLLSDRLSQLYGACQSAGKEAARQIPDAEHLDTTLSLINETHRARKQSVVSIQKGATIRLGVGQVSASLSRRQAPPSPPEATFRLFSRLSDVASWLHESLFLPRAAYIFRIVTFSAVARQIHLRMVQMKTLPAEWRSSRKPDISLEEKSRRYINFYNTVWLIANDLIVGWTISSILREHTTYIEHLVNATLRKWLVIRIVAGLQWLDDWPVGLKLNAPLSKLFGGIYAGLTTTWLSIVEGLPMTTSTIIWILTCLSFFGASMFISALTDILALASLHLRMATSISGAIYRAELAALYALWNLFRGKRWNALRNRVDSYDYEIDQLFLGTLLFTIALFLLPTIVTYYLFFAVIRLCLLYLQAANDTALSFINSFPLFALMLRFKEPSRLPGGVCFRLKYQSKTLTPFLELTSMPIGMSTLFGKFVSNGKILATGYSPAILLKKLVQGTL